MDSILAEGDWNILRTTFSGMTPKEMFVACRRGSPKGRDGE